VLKTQELASAALAAPFAGFGDFEVYPTLGEKAAIYCSRIVRYQRSGNGQTTLPASHRIYPDPTAKPCETFGAVTDRMPSM
jgi:hypothetical protein